LTSDSTESWTDDYLVYQLKEQLSKAPISGSHVTDLLDWYAPGHEYKVLDCRKYYNQTRHYLKIGALKPVPPYLISLSELTSTLIIKLAELDKADRDYVIKQAVALIFQEINPKLYHNSIASVLEVKLIE
jgi:hypothetical protein